MHKKNMRYVVLVVKYEFIEFNLCLFFHITMFYILTSDVLIIYNFYIGVFLGKEILKNDIKFRLMFECLI